MSVKTDHPLLNALLVIAILYLGSGSALAYESLTIEVFTASGIPIAKDFKAGYNSGTAYVYEIDGIKRIEAKLSEGLPADAGRSKRVVLQRFQQLREEDHARMQHAAMGLAKAMQYGVDRYPAIVFDGQAVVYGVTDVQTAITHYQTWRREGKR